MKLSLTNINYNIACFVQQFIRTFEILRFFLLAYFSQLFLTGLISIISMFCRHELFEATFIYIFFLNTSATTNIKSREQEHIIL